MAEMFGTPNGFRAYDEDQAKLREAASLSAFRDAQATHQLALSGLNAAQADAIRRKADQEERKLAKLQELSRGSAPEGSSAPTINDFLSTQLKAANAYGAMGDFDEAAKLLEKVAGVQQKVSASEASKALELKRIQEMEAKQFESVQQALAGVNNQRDLEVARLQLAANPVTASLLDPNKNAKFAALLQRYDPRGINMLLSGSKALLEKRQLAIQQADLERRQGDSHSRRETNKVRREVMLRQTQILEERAAAKEKAGGSPDRGVGNTSAGEVSAAALELKALGLTADGDTAGFQARAIAEEARLRVARNRGLSLPEARTQTIVEMVERGDLRPPKMFGAPKYAPKEGSLSRPLGLPKTPADLQPGRYYRGASGEIRKYTGDGWQVMTPAARVPQNVGSGTADPDEED